jgi:hypothetical protein
MNQREHTWRFRFILQPLKKTLPRKDSNLDKEYQKLLCYRYTTG